MIALQLGFNAIRWTGASQPLSGLVWLPILDRAYGHNLATGTGFIGYSRGALYGTLSVFSPGVDYLVYVTATYALADAEAAPAGAFEAFNGYVPPVQTTPITPSVPASGPGFVASAIAATPILGGMLVARTAQGLVPYSAASLDLLHLLFGVALNSALIGGSVSVQRGGYVLYPGLGLPTGATLFVGDNGRFATSSKGMAFCQIVGRAISADELVYQPEACTVLYPFSLSVLTS